jgi:phosphoglycerate dehydrogenase-like enzyme
MIKLPKAYLLNTPGTPFFGEIFNESFLNSIGEVADLDRQRVITPDNFEQLRPDLADAEVLLSTWGFPLPLKDELAKLPSLRALMHVAGSVKAFAEPFLERGIPVVHGREANSAVVAEFCFAQIILANKGYFQNIRDCAIPQTCDKHRAHTGPGNHGETVTLLGYGSIARKLLQLLKTLPLRVLVVDPTIDSTTAQRDEFELVSMKEAFSRALVVSNHLPDLPHLEKCLGGRLFASMRHGGTFINTGRGRQVDEDALATALAGRPDLTALLDVTEPEPPAPTSALFKLPNAILSSHIAGVVGKERQRLCDVVLEGLELLRDGRELKNTATLVGLELMG